MADLKNVNFMSSERYNDLIETNQDELYAVEASTPSMNDNSNTPATTEWLSKVCSPTVRTSVSSGYVTTRPSLVQFYAGGNNRTSWVNINDAKVFDSNWGSNYGSPDNIGYLVGAGAKITGSGVTLYILT